MPFTSPQDDYKVSLEVFEGPLDLLLYLIRRDELDIYNIPIEKITTQYSEYLHMMEMLDLNIAGEFIVMASTLALIKSRMLLPLETRPDESDEELEEADPRWDLVKQLVEYKRFKDAASRLQERGVMQQNVFGRGGELDLPEGAGDTARPLAEVGIFDLMTAFQEVLARAAEEPFGLIEPIRWSVPDKIDMILRLTRRSETVAFSKLFHAGSARGEIIVTFLALLELLRLRQVIVFQTATFSEILVRLVPEGLEENELPPPVVSGVEENDVG